MDSPTLQFWAVVFCVITSILCLLFILAFTGGIFSLFKGTLSSILWKKTNGIVESYSIEERFDEEFNSYSYTVEISYSYKVKHQQYIGNKIRHYELNQYCKSDLEKWGIFKLTPNDQISVYYSPINNSASRVSVGISIKDVINQIMVGMAAAVLLAVSLSTFSVIYTGGEKNQSVSVNKTISDAITKLSNYW